MSKKSDKEIARQRRVNRAAAMAPAPVPGVSTTNAAPINNTAANKNTHLSTVKWTIELQENLLTEIEGDKEVRIILFGKRPTDKNGSGITKKAAWERIASKVIPQEYKINPKQAGTKVGTQLAQLKKKFQSHNDKLVGTGGGVGGDDGNRDALREVEHDEYVPYTGPDESNTEGIKNLWDEIKKDFPLFPRLHEIYYGRPNQTAIATTTGIGPNGPRTVFHQKPSHSSSLDSLLSPFRHSPRDVKSSGPSGCHQHKSDPSISDSSSDIEILPPSPSPSPPPVSGKGKKVDPREQKANKRITKGIKSEPKVKVKVEKATPPLPSNKFSDGQEAVPTESHGGRKRKLNEDRSILVMMRDTMDQRNECMDAMRASKEAGREQEQNDKNFNEEMNRLDNLCRTGHITFDEFCKREDVIQVHYKRPRFQHTPPPAVVQPTHRTGSHPLRPSTSSNVPRTPLRTCAAPDDEVIDLTGSSPVYAPYARAFPFGTPIKQENMDIATLEELPPIPDPVDDIATPLFGVGGFDFAPTFRY
ncbi:hypothetical protein RhiLY_12751 [Ceratobasidium sp. AG-Ba]|nr:hypothetical protein RhiLY_12751 [Ceratobasidium sp. AG-Ba]